MRDAEIAVVHTIGHGFREAGIILGVDLKAGVARQFAQHGGGQLTGRAIAFDDRDQTILRLLAHAQFPPWPAKA
jgi:hypothetical protein